MPDTTPVGNVLSDGTVAWLNSLVTQLNKTDNPLQLPHPIAADAAERMTAKLANTEMKALLDLVAFFGGETAGGKPGEVLRLTGPGLLIGDAGNNSEAPGIYAGPGDPEGAVEARVGSLYLRTDGGANTSVYRKESGTDGTGWEAIGSGGGGSAPPHHKTNFAPQVVADADAELTTPLDVAPTANSLALSVNGVLATEGVDYSTSGTAVTWLASAPSVVNLDANDTLVAYYTG